MTDARNKISEIIALEVLSTKNQDGMGCSNAADAILPAAPALVTQGEE